MEKWGAAVCASFSVPMLSFSPGELSTIEGLHSSWPLPVLNGVTKVFNFTDLPCPPRSVMVSLRIMLQAWHNDRLTYLQEANWYTPEPGQPYRPLIALPRQLQAYNPAFANCKDIFFQGYDPPRALMPAAAMAPTVTQAVPRPSMIAPRPSAIPDPGPKETNIASSLQTGGVWQTKSSPESQIGTDQDSKRKADPIVSPTNNANENSGQHSYTEQPAQNNADTDSGQGPPLNPDNSKDGGDNPGQVGQQQSNGGLTNDPGTRITDSRSIPVALPRLPWIRGPVANTDGEVVQPLSSRISVAGTNMTPGGPAIKVSDTLMSLGSNICVIGTSSILLATDDPTQVVSTIAGQMITANPTAVEVGSSTLTPEDPGLLLSGTLVSLNNAGQLMVGSKTIPPRSKSSGGEESVTAVAEEGLTADPTAVQIGSFEPRPGGPRIISGAPNALDSIGSGNVINPKNGTGKGVQALQGSANALKSRFAGILFHWLLCACLTRLHV